MDAIAQGTYQGIKPVSSSKTMDSLQKNGLESIFLDKFGFAALPQLLLRMYSSVCFFSPRPLLLVETACVTPLQPSPKLRGRTVRSKSMRAPVRSEVGFKTWPYTHRKTYRKPRSPKTYDLMICCLPKEWT